MFLGEEISLNFHISSNFYLNLSETAFNIIGKHSATVHYLGAVRSFLGEERGETSTKLVNLITDIA